MHAFTGTHTLNVYSACVKFRPKSLDHSHVEEENVEIYILLTSLLWLASSPMMILMNKIKLNKFSRKLYLVGVSIYHLSTIAAPHNVKIYLDVAVK